MSHRLLNLLAATSLLLTACATAPIEEPEVPRALVGEAGGRAIGRYVVVPAHDEGSAVEEGFALKSGRNVMYLNRHGGRFAGGWDDSSQNRSSILGWSADISPYNGGDRKWQEVLSCTQRLFARFDVDVTDQDPGATPHVEAVVGGTPGEAGMGEGVGGVAPMMGDCSPIDRAVVYIFSEALGGDAQLICEVIGQEVAHAYGLDHQFLCSDPMTYLEPCGPKTFQDTAAQCGEYSARGCMCGGATQNSVDRWAEVLGVSAGDAGPPPSGGEVSPPPPPFEPDAALPAILSLTPNSGSSFPASTRLNIEVEVSEPAQVARVDLLWIFKGVAVVDHARPPVGVATTGGNGRYGFAFDVGRGARTFAVRVTDHQGRTVESDDVSVQFLREGPLPGEGQPPAQPPLAPADFTAAITQPADGQITRAGATLPVRIVTDGLDVRQVTLDWVHPNGVWQTDLTDLGGQVWGVDLDLDPAATTGTERILSVLVTTADGQRARSGLVHLQIQ